MINIKDIQDIISNKKDHVVTLPNENKFTQKTSYQMNIDLLENLINNQTLEINDYVHYSTNISQVNNKNHNQTANQTDSQIESKTVNQKNNNLIFNDTDIIDIRDVLLSIFDDNNINPKDYYLYGIKNNDSFYTSLILLTESDYIIKTRSEKLGYISSFKKELAINVSAYYNKYNYKESKFSKNSMVDKLVNTNLVDYSIQVLSSDFIKNNICILDITNKTYLEIKTLNECKNKDKMFLIIKYNENYIPIMNIDNNHLFKLDFIEFLSKEYNDFDFNSLSFNKRTFKIENASKIVLKSLSSYKLAELQELAVENNINVKKGDNKNKTKKELYDELKQIE